MEWGFIMNDFAKIFNDPDVGQVLMTLTQDDLYLRPQLVIKVRRGDGLFLEHKRSWRSGSIADAWMLAQSSFDLIGEVEVVQTAKQLIKEWENERR